jgi:hypothetical protein
MWWNSWRGVKLKIIEKVSLLTTNRRDTFLVKGKLMEGLQMKNIETFIDKHGWNLGVCWYRYGGGFFVLVAPYGSYVQDFSDLADMPGDIQSTSFYFYVNDYGEWLPIVYSEKLEEGLAQLNEKLSGEISQEWLGKVQAAYDKIIEVSDNSYGLYSAINAGTKELLL